MKNKVSLYCKGGCESFSNVGKNWLKILFNLEYCFSLKETDDIVRYLNNVDMYYKNWELDNVGHDYNAILLRGKDSYGNIEYILMSKED